VVHVQGQSACDAGESQLTIEHHHCSHVVVCVSVVVDVTRVVLVVRVLVSVTVAHEHKQS
jgi:hypothetical protein